VLARRQVKRASVIHSETRQLGLPATTIGQRLFPEQSRYVAHPVVTELTTGCPENERRRRCALAIPEFEHVTAITDTLRQTDVRRLSYTPAPPTSH